MLEVDPPGSLGTRTDIRDLFGRNRPGAAIDQALAALVHTGRARPQRVTTAGRPAELWTSAPSH